MIGVVKLTGEGVCSECGEECDAYPMRDEIDAPYGSISNPYKGPVYWLSCCCDAEVEELKVEEDIEDRW